ncbi:hypothetical protein ABI003_15005, partial [Enterococcus faecium]|uniref:hypothetical protein n=1 Tax=Enterococcus faecium TaxID=1352 RepID=UPI003F43F7D3
IKGKERVVRLYLSVALGFSLYGLWLYLTGTYQRFTSSYYWANPAAAYLIPAILVSLHKAMKKDARKWLWVSISSVFTASFFLTDSRAAL